MSEEVKTVQTEVTNDTQDFNFEAEKFMGGKYKTTEDAEAGFKNLQREYQKLKEENKKLKASKSTEEKPPTENADKPEEEEKPEEKSTEDKEEPKEDKPEPKNDLEKLANVADNTLNKVGLSLAKYQEEYNKNGSLSEESITEIISKTSISKEDLLNFINIAEQTRESTIGQQEAVIFEMAGGFENAQKIGKWAGMTALKDQTLKDYVEIFNTSTDFTQVKTAWEAINARYTKIFGKPPKVTVKGESGFTAGDVYQTREEARKDMKDPRYQHDSKFRKQVEEKYARSFKQNPNF